jgi:hypothetical protein
MRSLALGPLACALLAAACSQAGSASSPGTTSGTQPPGDDRDASLPDTTPDASPSLEDVPWDHGRVPYDGGTPAVTLRTPVTSETITTRVDTQELLFAAGEMQISGEPFASGFAGRNLTDYDRTALPPNLYILNLGTEEAVPMTDLFGFATAVESYEYSKYHMNMVAQMTGAGISLANGPVVLAASGATPSDKLITVVDHLYIATSAPIAGLAIVPPPTNNALNVLGFQGEWPNVFPFKSFDPTMAPDNAASRSCNMHTGYGGIPVGVGVGVPAYECAYNTLQLTNRDAQVDKTLVPAVLGFATWKEALWAIDFAGRLHDAYQNPVNNVAPADRPLVGTYDNKVVATDPPNSGVGTYIGSTPLEGTWGLTMCAEMDNAAALLLARFATDGKALVPMTQADAAAYDYTSALRWFPAATTLTEAATSTTAPFPIIQSLTIADAQSRSLDLAALLLGHSMFFAMTDARNAGIGQRIGLQLAFDGDPFAADTDDKNKTENTAHDRALAVIRVAFIDLDRMHTTSITGPVAGAVTADSATATGPGNTVTTTTLAHVEIGLRQSILALNGAISQYGGADPDPSADAQGILNDPPIHPTAPGAGTLMSPRIRQLFTSNALFVRDVLTKADGSVLNGVTIAGGVATPVAGAATVESQTAAARALTEAFLVTGDVSFRDRARAVIQHLESAFYIPAARMYRGVEGAADTIDMTAERWAWLESALRETYKVLSIPGDPVLGRDTVEDRIARALKLYLNGWDDLDGNKSVDTSKECLAGRLQLAEQSLTGELGRDKTGQPTSDRDSDCVLEVDDAKMGSVLAGGVRFHSP